MTVNWFDYINDIKSIGAFIAFVITIGAVLYIRYLKHQEKLIRQAPEKSRSSIIEKTLRGIPFANLDSSLETKDKVSLINKILDQQISKFKILVYTGSVLIILFSVMILFENKKKDPCPQTPEKIELIDTLTRRVNNFCTDAENLLTTLIHYDTLLYTNVSAVQSLITYVQKYSDSRDLLNDGKQGLIARTGMVCNEEVQGKVRDFLNFLLNDFHKDNIRDLDGVNQVIMNLINSDDKFTPEWNKERASNIRKTHVYVDKYKRMLASIDVKYHQLNLELGVK